MSIGNDISMHQIQGSSAGASEGLTTGGDPFGGVLEPHVWFSRTNLFSAGITRYRWSYRQITASNGITAVAGSWHHMDRNVIRHYVVENPSTHDLSFPTDQMGPDPGFPGQDIFRIQPLAPPAPGIEWTGFIDAREDTATAFFETHLLEGGNAEAAAGKYELKLELFKTDGTLVDLTAAGVILKVATTDAPFGTQTVNTRTLDAAPASPDAQYLFKNGAGHVVGFRLVVRVDNNPCQAVINPLTGAGLTPDEDCGFLRYLTGATAAHISFKARHPHNFATFSFTTFRGVSKFIPEASASGPVGSSPLNGFVRDASSTFSKDVSVTTLLTSNSDHACTKGAFAENLYVWAMATDGWSRLSYLDASGLPVAYALEPSS